MSEQMDEIARQQVRAVEAVAERWADVLTECKQADPRWILDRSVTGLDSALTELRAALDLRFPQPPPPEEAIVTGPDERGVR